MELAPPYQAGSEQEVAPETVDGALALTGYGDTGAEMLAARFIGERMDEFHAWLRDLGIDPADALAWASRTEILRRIAVRLGPEPSANPPEFTGTVSHRSQGSRFPVPSRGLAESGTSLTLKDIEDLPDHPGKPFVTWLARGLRDRSLSHNVKGARVHVVAEGLLLVSPSLFRDYEAASGEPWKQAQRQFLRLRLHARTASGEDLHRYALGTTERLIHGHLVPGGQTLLGDDPPPPNARLHPCPPDRLCHS